MDYETRIVSPTTGAGRVKDSTGKVLRVPQDWVLVPPGDAALTRRIKTGGPAWAVQEKKGRRTFSKGLWAERARVEAIRANLAEERAKPAYAKRLATGRVRREKEQARYAEDFESEVRSFLRFHPSYSEMEAMLAHLVSAHATPVGSGTVARTKRIPVAQRAEAAVIAWMRHQTTAYDNLKIARVRGKRREVRRVLAERSRELLDSYRRGDSPGVRCPLRAALG